MKGFLSTDTDLWFKDQL